MCVTLYIHQLPHTERGLSKVSQISSISGGRLNVAAVNLDGNNLSTLHGIKHFPALIQVPVLLIQVLVSNTSHSGTGISFRYWYLIQVLVLVLVSVQACEILLLFEGSCVPCGMRYSCCDQQTLPLFFIQYTGMNLVTYFSCSCL